MTASMNAADIVVQQPEGVPGQLVLLFHGVGATAADMLPLARRLAERFPQAFVVCVNAPVASDLGQGFQWFSVVGIDEASRPARVAAAMDGFVEQVRGWQRASGASIASTALVGFSQGAIMALESTARPDALAGRIVAIAGRYAAAPHAPPAGTTLHLIHGKADPVIGYAHTVRAAEALVAAGADLTADVLPFVGHRIDDRVAELLIERLTTYVPRRLWEEALRSAPDDT